MSIIDPKSQMSTLPMLVPLKLGYPKTSSTKIGFLKPILENCTTATLIYSTNSNKPLQGAIKKLRDGLRGEGINDFVTYCYIYFEGEGGYFLKLLRKGRHKMLAPEEHFPAPLMRYKIIEIKSIDQSLPCQYCSKYFSNLKVRKILY